MYLLESYCIRIGYKDSLMPTVFTTTSWKLVTFKDKQTPIKVTCMYVVLLVYCAHEKSFFERQTKQHPHFIFCSFFQDCPREGPVDSHFVKNSAKTNKCISGCLNTSKMNNNISLISIISCVTPFSEKKFQKQTWRLP